MKTFTKIFRVAVGVAVAVGFAGKAVATTITFDAAFTSPATPSTDSLGRQYSSPDGTSPPTTFVTQGFSFGGFGMGLPGLPPQPEMFILENATACPTELGGNVCTLGDGSDYLVAFEPFAMLSFGRNIALTSFQATQIFGPDGCVECNDEDGSDIPNAVSVQLIGFRFGTGQFAMETFALTGAFQTFTLTDPGWANTTRVVFQGLDSAGEVVGAGLYGIDNINARVLNPVPEPGTLVLLGSGLAAIAARRRRAARRE